MDTVLVADDDDELRQVYELWLEDIGEWDVRTAADGDEALARLDDAVDVAVLDRRMPGATGDEVAADIQSTMRGCDVIMVSAYQPDGNIDQAVYDRYLTKPVRKEELMEAIASELGNPHEPR